MYYLYIVITIQLLLKRLTAMKNLTMEEKLSHIDKDIRFGICECYQNGLYETSIFFNENFDGKLDKELSDRFVLCPRQEIAETVAKNANHVLAYNETFYKFEVWLLANKIQHNIDFTLL